MYKVLEKKENTILVEMDFDTFENIKSYKLIPFRRPSLTNNIEFESFSENELEELMSEGKKSYDSICNSLKGI